MARWTGLPLSSHVEVRKAVGVRLARLEEALSRVEEERRSLEVASRARPVMLPRDFAA